MKALRVLLTGLSVLLPAVAAAQDFPSKPIRLIVPFPPGGGSDIVARKFAQKMTEHWGQQVVVDGREGGAVVSEFVAKAPPDGYTLLLATTGVMAINQKLYRTENPASRPARSRTPPRSPPTVRTPKPATWSPVGG